MTEIRRLPAALAGCVEACERCARVVASISQAQFAESDSGHSSVGAHMRHCLDHFDCFFSGVDSGCIDYDARARDARVETDPSMAQSVLDTVNGQFMSLAEKPLDAKIRIRQRASLSHAPVEMTSTIERELIFLSGHTVHHLALIEAVLMAQGIPFDENMARAFSTEAYRRAAS